MADFFKFRQKPIAAFLAALRIPTKPPESGQEAKSTMNAPLDIPEDEETPQSGKSSTFSPGADFENDSETPAMPLFDTDPKKDQANLVKTIGSRMREARELCNMAMKVAAKSLGYSTTSMLSKVEEATDTNSVPLWLIVRASKLYDVSMDFLFGLTDDWETGLQRPVQGWLLDTWQAARIHDLAELEKLHRRISAVSSLLPAVADESDRTAEAIERFAELNPKFEDMRGSARLAAAADNLTRLAGNANAVIQRFRIEIGVDHNNPPTSP